MSIDGTITTAITTTGDSSATTNEGNASLSMEVVTAASSMSSSSAAVPVPVSAPVPQPLPSTGYCICESASSLSSASSCPCVKHNDGEEEAMNDEAREKEKERNQEGTDSAAAAADAPVADAPTTLLDEQSQIQSLTPENRKERKRRTDVLYSRVRRIKERNEESHLREQVEALVLINVALKREENRLLRWYMEASVYINHHHQIQINNSSNKDAASFAHPNPLHSTQKKNAFAEPLSLLSGRTSIQNQDFALAPSFASVDPSNNLSLLLQLLAQNAQNGNNRTLPIVNSAAPYSSIATEAASPGRFGPYHHPSPLDESSLLSSTMTHTFMQQILEKPNTALQQPLTSSLLLNSSVSPTTLSTNSLSSDSLNSALLAELLLQQQQPYFRNPLLTNPAAASSSSETLLSSLPSNLLLNNNSRNSNFMNDSIYSNLLSAAAQSWSASSVPATATQYSSLQSLLPHFSQLYNASPSWTMTTASLLNHPHNLNRNLNLNPSQNHGDATTANRTVSSDVHCPAPHPPLAPPALSPPPPHSNDHKIRSPKSNRHRSRSSNG